MVRVTTVHMEGGENHEHIARVGWTNPQTGDSGQSTREQMIEYLRKPGTRRANRKHSDSRGGAAVHPNPRGRRLDQQPIGSPAIRSHVNYEPTGYQRPAVGRRTLAATLLFGSTLDPADVRAAVPVVSDPLGLITASGQVWTQNFGDGTLSRIDPVTSRATSHLQEVVARPPTARISGSPWTATGW